MIAANGTATPWNAYPRAKQKLYQMAALKLVFVIFDAFVSKANDTGTSMAGFLYFKNFGISLDRSQTQFCNVLHLVI